MKHMNPNPASPARSGSSVVVASLLTLVALESSVLTLAAVTRDPIDSPQQVAPSTSDAASPGVSTSSAPSEKNPLLHMTAVTEFTDYGKTLPAASARHPVYYVSHDCGQRSKGEASADEKSPPPADLARLLQESLATNGFRPADSPEHKPALTVYYHYGSHRQLDPETAKLYPDKNWTQQTERAYLIGGKAFGHRFERWGRHDVLFSFSRQKQAFLIEQLSNDIHYIVVSAYAFDELAKNAPRLVWRTTLTVNGRGSSMTNTLGPLVLSASPFFGRETGGAVAMQRAVKPGTVELGPLGIIDDPMLAAADANANRSANPTR
jgi:hypothetical protein